MNINDYSKKLRQLLHDQPEHDVPRIVDKLVQASDNSMGNLDIIYAHLYAALYYCNQADASFFEFASDVETLQDEIFE